MKQSYDQQNTKKMYTKRANAKIYSNGSRGTQNVSTLRPKTTVKAVNKVRGGFKICLLVVFT